MSETIVQASRALGAPRGGSRAQRRIDLLGYAYVSPWILGFVLFTLGPMLASLLLSFKTT